MHPADKNRADDNPNPRWQPPKVSARENGADNRSRRSYGGEVLRQEPGATRGLVVQTVALGVGRRWRARVEPQKVCKDPTVPAIRDREDDAGGGEKENQ